MERINLIIAAFRERFGQDFGVPDYMEANKPFGNKGVSIWLQYKQGTTKN